MSKSKGNTVDPLGLIDQYGADALRFTLAAMESQGRDIKLDEKRVEGYRNFATKLWNAARFLQMNGVGASDGIAAPQAELPVNRWIIGEVVGTLAKLNRAFEELRYDEMADAIYHFVWGTFCDWYVELIKGAFDDETKTVAAWAFDQILVMLHPLMPFITEELWNAMGQRPYELIVAKWPEPEAHVDADAKRQMVRVIEVIGSIRAKRNESGLAPGSRLPMAVLEDPHGELGVLQANTNVISQLARVTPAEIEYTPVPGSEEYESETFHIGLKSTFQKIDRPSKYWRTSIQIPTETMILVVGLDGFADVDAERQRMLNALGQAEKERDSLAQRLANPNFTERAKPEAVEKARADHDAKSAEAERLRAALERLG
jgi:valyl-tRNA synthetase